MDDASFRLVTLILFLVQNKLLHSKILKTVLLIKNRQLTATQRSGRVALCTEAIQCYIDILYYFSVNCLHLSILSNWDPWVSKMTYYLPIEYFASILDFPFFFEFEYRHSVFYLFRFLYTMLQNSNLNNYKDLE